MEPSNIQFLGAPCGEHGPYTFYKGFKYCRNGRSRVLTIGEFFFVKILKDTAICLAELHLLWQDRNHEDLQLASARLYFLPENTPEGRLSYHGEDELLAESEKVVLSVEDLLSWVVEDDVCWPWGRPAVHDSVAARKNIDLYCPPDVTAEADQLIEAFSANNAGVNFKDDLEKIRKSDQEPEKTQAKQTEVLVLSFSQYCRYRAVLCRLSGCTNVWLKSALISAIGGFAVKSADTRIHFCRDTVDHPDLEDHEFRQDHLAPKLKGRPRRKRRSWRREWSLESDSNDSSEHAAYVPKPEKRMPLGLQKKTSSSTYLNTLSPVKIQGREASSPNGKMHRPKEQEQAFLKRLHEFMRMKKSPIGRIPTLGFKEIDLYEFYTYAKKLGGYEEITSKRLWKHIYDKLGGNPTNTSAATCTRRHYERLLLPYELHLRGEEQRLVAGSAQSRKVGKPGKSINNTVRNHLREKQSNAGFTAIKVPSTPLKTEHLDASNIAKSAAQTTNGRDLSLSNIPGFALPVPTSANAQPSVKSESRKTTQGYMPLGVPPNLLLPPGMTLPPGMLLGPLPGMPTSSQDTSVPGNGVHYTQSSLTASTCSTTASLSVPQKNEATFSNRPPKHEVNLPTSLPPNVQVLPNGTIISTMPPKKEPGLNTSTSSYSNPQTQSVKVEGRPSVIQHTAQKTILNPAPSVRPNIPQTVYGPPNVMPAPTSESSYSHKRPYPHHSTSKGATGDLRGLPKPPLNVPGQSPSYEVPNKRNRVDPSSWSSVSSFMPASNRPPSQMSSVNDEPTDLSMKPHRGSTSVRDVKPQVEKRSSSEVEAPLNLSLKAHQMPKTASVCVPKLPVNPFKPVNVVPLKTEAPPMPVVNNFSQRVEKTNHRTASSKPEQRVESTVPRTAAPQLPLPPNLDNPEALLASLGALQLVHPAFPAFPMGTMLPGVPTTQPPPLSSTPTSPAITMTTTSLAPPLPPSLLGPNMYFPGLPAYALSAVANQVYPHLYLPTSAGATAPPSHSPGAASSAPGQNKK